jgi:hypothetical protein
MVITVCPGLLKGLKHFFFLQKIIPPGNKYGKIIAKYLFGVKKEVDPSLRIPSGNKPISTVIEYSKKRRGRDR